MSLLSAAPSQHSLTTPRTVNISHIIDRKCPCFVQTPELLLSFLVGINFATVPSVGIQLQWSAGGATASLVSFHSEVLLHFLSPLLHTGPHFTFSSVLAWPWPDLQAAWAPLTIYRYCSAITLHIIITVEDNERTEGYYRFRSENEGFF